MSPISRETTDLRYIVEDTKNDKPEKPPYPSSISDYPEDIYDLDIDASSIQKDAQSNLTVLSLSPVCEGTHSKNTCTSCKDCGK